MVQCWYPPASCKEHMLNRLIKNSLCVRRHWRKNATTTQRQPFETVARLTRRTSSDVAGGDCMRTTRATVASKKHATCDISHALKHRADKKYMRHVFSNLPQSGRSASYRIEEMSLYNFNENIFEQINCSVVISRFSKCFVQKNSTPQQCQNCQVLTEHHL